MDSRTLYIVSILAPDRPGIIADVAEALYRLGGNLEAASQTIMQGWFTMVISVSFPADVARDQVAAALRAGDRFDVVVHEARNTDRTVWTDGEPYIMTAIGDDKPGIVRRLARCCADRRVNIDDVWNEVRQGRFITIFHVTVPRDVDAKDLRYNLESVARELGILLTLQHQDVFTATNSLEVHSRKI